MRENEETIILLQMNWNLLCSVKIIIYIMKNNLEVALYDTKHIFYIQQSTMY